MTFARKDLYSIIIRISEMSPGFLHDSTNQEHSTQDFQQDLSASHHPNQGAWLWASETESTQYRGFNVLPPPRDTTYMPKSAITMSLLSSFERYRMFSGLSEFPRSVFYDTSTWYASTYSLEISMHNVVLVQIFDSLKHCHCYSCRKEQSRE